MISLNVYLTAQGRPGGRPRNGNQGCLDSRDDAAARLPCALRSTRRSADEDLAALEANKPPFAYEMVSYWRTEQERVGLGRPRHPPGRSGRRSSSTAPTSPTPCSTADTTWSM